MLISTQETARPLPDLLHVYMHALLPTQLHTFCVRIPHPPPQINQIFDAISYNKGASTIRMAFEWLGHEVAFKGLHNYLVKVIGGGGGAEGWGCGMK